jgi:hypothetical protein
MFTHHCITCVPVTLATQACTQPFCAACVKSCEVFRLALLQQPHGSADAAKVLKAFVCTECVVNRYYRRPVASGSHSYSSSGSGIASSTAGPRRSDADCTLSAQVCRDCKRLCVVYGSHSFNPCGTSRVMFSHSHCRHDFCCTAGRSASRVPPQSET